MESKEILQYVQHRYPFLLIDRVTSIDPGKRAEGIKNVTANEWFFQGHFPENPIMPGVLIVEALAQLAAASQAYTDSLTQNSKQKAQLGFLAGVRDFKFVRPVVPGDVLHLKVEFLRRFGRIIMVQSEAKVNNCVVASGKLLFALMEES